MKKSSFPGGLFLLLTQLFPFDTLNIRGVGPMAEWLGTGLQNLLRRFNSASDLKISSHAGVLVGISFV
jgi:hypothetical protein